MPQPSAGTQAGAYCPRSPLALGLALLAGVLAIYVVPFFVPVAPAISESYLVGFNNHASLFAFLAFLALFASWNHGFGLHAPVPIGTPPIAPARTLLAGALAAFFLLTVGVWLGQRAHPALGEALYFLDRLGHLDRGELPYLQFEFPYGPLLLYLPLACERLLRVSLADAYYLSWILETLIGVLLIYGCVTLLPGERPRKNIVFLLSLITWWASPFTFGANYTAFRFFLAPFLCLLLATRLTSPRLSPLLLAQLLLAMIALLLVSPEQGMAFFGAIVAFLLLSSWQARAPLPALYAALFVALAFPCYVLARNFGLFRTLVTMSNGGYNFPLIPVPAHLPVFALLLVAACVLSNTLRSRQLLSSVDLLILLGLFSLPAGFGRADLGHILINTVSALLAAWITLAQYPGLFRRTARAYILLVIFLPAPLFLFLCVRAQWKNRSTFLVPAPALAAAVATSPNHPTEFEPLAPFGRPLPNSPSLPSIAADTGFYNGLESVTAFPQIEQKIAELQRAPARPLLVPKHFTCAYTLDRNGLRKSLLTPFVPAARRTSVIYQPLCTYIRAHYQESGLPSGLNLYETWIPRP